MISQLRSSVATSGLFPVGFTDHVFPTSASLFGWRGTPSLEIVKLSQRLMQKGKLFNVWRSQQAEALKWLLGVQQVEQFLECQSDQVIHDLFFRIMCLHDLHDSPSAGELSQANEVILRIKAQLQNIEREYFGIDEGVRDLAASYGLDISTDIQHALGWTGELSKFLNGVPDMHYQVIEKLEGTENAKHRTNPPDSARRLATILAADVYRTALGVPPERNRKPSFKTFLTIFTGELMNLGEDAIREMARTVWRDGGYKGVVMGGDVPQLFARHAP